ncbi:MAG TPA: TolC family protein [Paludibacter sp.]|nr:TolC family protein [Paludibacter sp.]
MSRKTFPLSLLVLFFMAPGISGQVVRLSLADATSRALQKNTAILNSQLDIKISKKKVWETIAQGLPHVDAKSAYQHLFSVPTISLPGTRLSDTYIPVDPSTGAGTISQLQLSTGEYIYLNNVIGPAIPLGVKDNISADITVSQLVFNGSFFVGLMATKVYSELTLHNVEKTRLDVLETVANTYRMLQMAEESRKILTRNLENTNKTLSEISEMNKQGFLEKTDVDQLEIAANNVRNALNRIDSNLDMGYRLLKIQLGIEDSVRVELGDEMETGESLTSWGMRLLSEQFNIEQNVDYKLVLSSEKAARIDLRLAQSRFFPTINAFYNHNEQLNSAAFNPVPKDVVGVNVSLPIFSSGERLAIASQKRLALRQAENTRELVANSLLMQAREYQSDVRLKMEKYLNQKKNKELSELIYQRTLEKYRQGLASSMDLMNSQNQFLTSLTDYYQSIYDLQGSRARLLKMFNISDLNR